MHLRIRYTTTAREKKGTKLLICSFCSYYVCVLLQEFSNALFSLFDQDLNTVLDQEDWFEMLRINTR